MNERDIFFSALEFDDPDVRQGYLKSACAGDERLLARVELLFSMHDDQGPFLDTPVVEQLGDELPKSIATTLLNLGDSHLSPPYIEGYELIRILGRGGMGVVYEARDLRLNRLVAIKMIRTRDHSETSSLSRFRREARAAARLQHPNIVQVFEVGEQDGHPYLVLELINGGSLGRLTGGVPQPARQAAELLEILARAVQYAHDHSIIHRDLKPGNILIETTAASGSKLPGIPPGSSSSSSKSWHSESSAKSVAGGRMTSDGLLAKITDFGLAKELDIDDAQTMTGEIMGTPKYMAPEQAQGRREEIGLSVDIYALGAILFELLTGRPPFQGANSIETMQMVIQDEPVPPTRLQPRLPRDIETICLKCLEKDPARRYAAAGLLADDLRRFLNSEPIYARPVSRVERCYKWARRKPAIAGLVATVVLVASIGVAGVTLKWREAEQQRARADSALRNAEGKRQQAEVSQREFQRMSARLMMERGVTFCNQGAYGKGLLWLANGLEVVPPGDEELEQSLRMLIGGWGRRLPAQKAVVQFGSSVEAAAFSPDGRTIVIGCTDGNAWLWQAPPPAVSAARHEVGDAPVAGRPRKLDAGHKASVVAVAFSPDGRTVATADAAGTIQVWTSTGQALGTPLSQHARIRVLAFSPDSRTLASAGNDNTTRLWEVETGREKSEPLKHQGHVRTLAFSPNGKMLATGSDDYTARIWDATTGDPVGEVLKHQDGVRAIAFSPDSRLVLTGSNSRKARLWEAETGTMQREPIEHTRPVAGVAFSPDGRLFATACEDHRAYLWRADTGEAAGPPLVHDNEVYSVEFSPDGRTLLTDCDDGGARLWDVETGEILGEPMWSLGDLNAVTFSPNGRHVLTAGDDGTIRLWQTIRGHEPDRTLGPADRAVRAVTFSPDGATLFVGSVTGRRYDRASGRLLGTIESDRTMIGAAAYSPNGKIIATGGFDDAARLWDAQAGHLIGEPLRHLKPSWIPSVAFSPDGHTLLTASGNYDYEHRRGEAQLWDVATGRLLRRLDGHDREVTAVAYAADGKTVVTASRDGSVRFWDALTGKPSGEPLLHERWVVSIALSKDGRIVTACHDRGTARIWDVATRTQVLAPLEHPANVDAVAFSPDGRLIVTCCTDGMARFWDAASGNPVDVPVRHGDKVVAVAYSPDGAAILTGSVDRFARLVPVPRPCAMPVDKVQQWIRVNTSMQLNRGGDVSKLSHADWQKQVLLLVANAGL